MPVLARRLDDRLVIGCDGHNRNRAEQKTKRRRAENKKVKKEKTSNNGQINGRPTASTNMCLSGKQTETVTSASVEVAVTVSFGTGPSSYWPRRGMRQRPGARGPQNEHHGCNELGAISRQRTAEVVRHNPKEKKTATSNQNGGLTRHGTSRRGGQSVAGK